MSVRCRTLVALALPSMFANAPTTPWRHATLGNNNERNPMIYTIAVVLIILWLLGMVSSYTLGGALHVLLVIALVVIVVNLLRGRKTL
jgi:hypothetical protein